ncbi:MAG: M20/M25/M40 family metallo-hydrolase [Caldilineales bacterium]|nr:M20/M25/M40 family metallo-hydrolase [Caldilineales bacterium]
MNPADTINPDRLLATFLELVQVDSPSGHEAEIGLHLAGRLQDLGCSVEKDEVGNLIARLDGEGDDSVLLSAHMDTVGEDWGIKPVIRDGIIYSEGETILGSDDKSGIAVILETLTSLHEQHHLPHPPLEIVISVGEERSLWGARQLDKSRLRSKWGFVFDSGGPIGTIVYSAPSQTSLDVTVRGKKAHAGSEPENGINAIRVAAEAIASMPLGRIDAQTTANIGIIRGGEARNIVPDRVTLVGEARSRDEATLDEQVRLMVDALNDAAARHQASVDIQVQRIYHTYQITPDQRPYAAAARAFETLGFQVRPKMSGGGTDGNIYIAAGIPCVVLSTGMADVHTSDEHIAVQDMIDAARALITLLVLEAQSE